MGFALKFNMLDVVVDNSLKNIYINGNKTGFQFDIRLDYYRGHFLSVIDRFEVTVDDEKVEEQDITFCLNGKEFGVCQLESCYTEFWNIMDSATIKVNRANGLDEGDHKIDVTLIFRSPYMSIGPNHQYMPVDSCGSKTLSIIG